RPSFSFPSSRAPTRLPSFPTRRSSDLLARRRDRGLVPIAQTPVVLHLVSQPHQLRSAARFGPVHARLAFLSSGRRRRLRHPLLGDRKSTRLNSSHQIISYAVFCLKKKI